MIRNKKPRPIVIELFIRGRKLNFPTDFIAQYYFELPKNVRLNCTHLLL